MWTALILGGIKIAFLIIEEVIRNNRKQDEKDKELKIEKTKVLQSGVRAIIDQDVSRLNTAIVDANRLRKK